MNRPAKFLAPLTCLGILAPQAPDDRLADLLGVPYLVDGVQDERGRWTTFADPGRILDGPGLNCSGFLLAAARRLLGYHGTPAEAGRDRRGDSGPDAASGPDWDFGWDLVLNLSEGRPRQWLPPDREAAEGDAREAHGFAVQDAGTWRDIRSRMRSDRVYLAAFLRRRTGTQKYHHVALLLKDPGGSVWLYQTLPRGRVHRLCLSTPAGFASLCRMFGPAERIRILEVAPPATY